METMRSFLIPIALSLSLGAHAAPPQRLEIHYEVTHNGTAIAEVTERLEHDKRQYRAEELWKGKGVFALRGDARRMSRGSIAPDGLRPAEFEDKRPGRDARRLTFDGPDKVPALQRQDRLSLMWNFAFVPPKTDVTVRVTDEKGNESTHVYQVKGRERVRVPAGEFDALKVARKHDQPARRTTEIWFATDRSFLPVKIMIDRDGARSEQVAVRINAQ
ncbi:MAG TPA: DUF3108 domain-containing protein [Vicinamibacterales bacterium]|nr:DUF3108 domain-containing protein [Vicinamibacterales bacterium]